MNQHMGRRNQVRHRGLLSRREGECGQRLCNARGGRNSDLGEEVARLALGAEAGRSRATYLALAKANKQVFQTAI
jgi:hypothetical protein